MEFSFKEIISLLMKRFLLIIICTFTGMCILFITNQYMIRPSYTATVQMYVNTNETAGYADLNELYYAQKVVNTYINFLQTKVFYTQVLEQTGLNYNLTQLKNMTAIKAINNTEIFQISVTSNSPEDSYQLVQAMQEISPDLINSIKATTKISVVDPAVLPTLPSGPNILINTLAGGILGFLIAIVSSFILELVDVNVKNEEELTKKYQKPILGSIPNYNVHQIRNNLLLKLFRNNPLKILSRIKILRKFHILKFKQTVSKRVDHTINDDTRFMIAEAYKSLRTNLRYTLRKEGCKKLLINSPIPEDGKSTTCTNIGITIAQTGAKVLLLDCDLRKGRLHNFFSLQNAPGISDILSGMVNERDVIQDTTYTDLHVITMGSVPPNPAELLASTQMEDLMKRLEKSYDYIILDSAPVNVVSDALSLTKMVDGIVMVVRENRTSHPNIANAITKFDYIDSKILGFVLNATTQNQSSKSKSKYYYYRKSTND